MKILVVDDDVNICELLRLYLVKEGWEVLVSYNGIKAMELFKTENPDFVPEFSTCFWKVMWKTNRPRFAFFQSRLGTTFLSIFH